MKATSTYINCYNLTTAQIEGKITQVQSRIATLSYIINNRHYTKAHRYDAVIESMALECQLESLKQQLQYKVWRQNNSIPQPATSTVKPSNAPLRSRAKIHSDVNPNFHIRHRLMTAKEKELLQRDKNMYAFLDKYTLN